MASYRGIRQVIRANDPATPTWPAAAAGLGTTARRRPDPRGTVEAEAAGYLLKDARRSDLVKSIRPATRREREVLALVARGLTNIQIGRELHVSEATVKTHLARACANLGVTGRTAAVARAMQAGAPPPERTR